MTPLVPCWVPAAPAVQGAWAWVVSLAVPLAGPALVAGTHSEGQALRMHPVVQVVPLGLSVALGQVSPRAQVAPALQGIGDESSALALA